MNESSKCCKLFVCELSHLQTQTMLILPHCTDTEKKLLLSKVRKASGTGKSIESQTSKRDVCTSTEDLGLFASVWLLIYLL